VPIPGFAAAGAVLGAIMARPVIQVKVAQVGLTRSNRSDFAPH
jgi:hypothetical protein